MPTKISRLVLSAMWARFGPSFLGVLIPALQIQLSLVLGFGFCIPVSIFYAIIGDSRYPPENTLILVIGLGFSLTAYLIGGLLSQLIPEHARINLRRGAWIVVLAWFIACSISAVIYLLAGFPDPQRLGEYGLIRRLIDSYYESLSGFATAGTSVLPSVEVFPRGILLWRSMTHWIGGIGIAYLTLTVMQQFRVSRAEIINSEIDSPHQILFKNEQAAVTSGWQFIRIYCFLAMVLFVLLMISGMLFRAQPYVVWYDNVFDALTFTMSTIASGGFAIYDTSAGLPVMVGAKVALGGLQNPISEWIIAVFMLITALNLGLWYSGIFSNRWKSFWENSEARVFVMFVVLMTVSIWLVLVQNQTYGTVGESLRYAFFNVSTIISTTGLANQDFTKWPIQAQGILFMCYLVGGCIGSTAGGLKFHRYLVLYHYAKLQGQNLIHGRSKSWFVVDGIRYNDRTAGIVILNMMLFFSLFLLSSVGLMLTSSHIVANAGEQQSINLETAFTASIANLGGIGPAAVTGIANAGPVGNYSAFSELSKVMLMGLMFIGRIGVLSAVMLFITQQGQSRIGSNLGTGNQIDTDERLLI